MNEYSHQQYFKILSTLQSHLRTVCYDMKGLDEERKKLVKLQYKLTSSLESLTSTLLNIELSAVKAQEKLNAWLIEDEKNEKTN